MYLIRRENGCYYIAETSIRYIVHIAGEFCINIKHSDVKNTKLFGLQKRANEIFFDVRQYLYQIETTRYLRIFTLYLRAPGIFHVWLFHHLSIIFCTFFLPMQNLYYYNSKHKAATYHEIFSSHFNFRILQSKHFIVFGLITFKNSHIKS